jgi:hypothetical protein
MACGSQSLTDTGAKGANRLTIIAGDSVADTATAILASPLAVQIQMSGGVPAPGTPVLFQVALSASVAAVDTGPFRQVASIGTDPAGVARVRVQLGTTAGVGMVAISVASLGLNDTGYYTIRPGLAAHIRIMPHDSAVYIGGHYGVWSAVTDRNGNPRSDLVTYASGGASVSVSGAGVVTGDTIGRSAVVARDGGAVDTAWVSVVPGGTVAAWANRLTEPSSIVRVNLDGSGYRRVTTSVVAIYDMVPYWFPDSGRLVYQDVHSGATYDTLRLFTVDLGGAVRRLAQSYTGYPLISENWAQPSRDGRYVYFYGQGANAQNGGLWQAEVDSQVARFIGPPINNGWDYDDHPSPSPDGTRLVYDTNRDVTCQGCVQLRILHVATGAVDSLKVPGQTPRWSPTSEQIAFLGMDASLAVMLSDGSGVRTIGPTGRYYTYGIDWSPDGTWVVARSDLYDRLELVHVASGLTLPLAFTAGLKEPSWRP